jgi:dienelactone hydrolase
MRLRGVLPLGLWATVLVAGAVAVRSRPAGDVAGQTSDGEAFVVTSGPDTVALESFTRVGSRLEGDLLDLASTNRRESYVAVLSGDSSVASFELAVRPANSALDTPPVRRAAVTFGSDGWTGRARTGPDGTRRLAARAGSLPYLDLSAALLELATARARALGGDRVDLPLFDVNGGRPLSATLTRVGADSMSVRIGPSEARLRVDENGRILGGVFPARHLTLARSATHGQRLDAPDYSAPPGAPYSAEDVEVRASATHTLAGTLTLPTDRGGPYPAVVVVTGSGPQERDGTYLGTYRPFRQIADGLSRHGIAVLRLDDRGVGRSTGRFTLANSADFADDVRSALSYLRQRPEIDPSRLGLIGESEGGLIASMVAATDPDLRALILMGTPSRTGRNLIDSQVRYRLEHDGAVPEAKRDSVVNDIEARNERLARVLPWLRFILDYDPIPTATKVTTPVLILHGDSDRQVTPNQAEELGVALRAGGNRDVSIRIFPHLNHLFLQDDDGDPERYASLASKSVPPSVLGEITTWSVQHLSSLAEAPDLAPAATD